MSQIYYLCHYDVLKNKEEGRDYALSAVNIISYILSAIEKKGRGTKVVSACITKHNRFYKGKTIPLGEKSTLRLFATFSHSSRILRFLGRCMTGMLVFFYLLFHLKKEDTLIVYHSLALMNSVQWLKKLKKFHLILQVEEIYGDVTEDAVISQKELAYFRCGDSYLFATGLLNKKVNVQNKPYAVIYGAYQLEEERQKLFERDGKIHCVYAGTLVLEKGGAAMAISAAKNLPENYHIHILGFGTPTDETRTKETILQLSKECACSISFHGCLRGEDYIRFLQSCQIGLSTQNPMGSYNDTSFPSKILSYMANGLQVVTVRIPVVEESSISQWMHYYDTPTPQNIAEAIMEVDPLDGGDIRNAIKKLDRKFTQEIGKLLEE